MRAALVLVLLLVTVALAGCRPGAQGAGDRPAGGPGTGEVHQQEDVVNDLDGIVGSAEAETADD